MAEKVACKDNCSLCGGKKLEFEPPTLYCNQCSSRVKRSQASAAVACCATSRLCVHTHSAPVSHRRQIYYTTAANKYHLCGTCYSGLRKVSVRDVGERCRGAVVASWSRTHVPTTPSPRALCPAVGRDSVRRRRAALRRVHAPPQRRGEWETFAPRSLLRYVV
jgi:hypothetical protein